MKNKFEIKTIEYYPFFISVILLCIVVIIFLLKVNTDTLGQVFTGVIFATMFFVLIYFFRGKFIAEVIDDNYLSIKWIKKPLFSNKKNEQYHIENIIEINSPRNISWAPDRFIMNMNSGKVFSFFIPTFSMKNEVDRLRDNLNAILYARRNNIQ